MSGKAQVDVQTSYGAVTLFVDSTGAFNIYVNGAVVWSGSQSEAGKVATKFRALSVAFE